MTIKTATGIQRIQDERGLGKWFDLLFSLVQTRVSFKQRQSSTVVRRLKRSRTKVVPHSSQSRASLARL